MPACCRVANVIVRDADYDHSIAVPARCCAVMGVDIADNAGLSRCKANPNDQRCVLGRADLLL